METCCEECIGHQRALRPWTDDDEWWEMKSFPFIFALTSVDLYK